MLDWIESRSSGSLQGSAISDGAGRCAVAVNAVCAGAEHRDVLPGNLLGAVEDEMLVASADPTITGDLHRDLATADYARAWDFAMKGAQAPQQVVRGAGAVPIIARAVDFHPEA